MTNKEQEERNLAEADRHIARAKELIQGQRRRIAQAQGVPAEEQEELLSTMLESLALMESHRVLILDNLVDLRKFP